MAFKTIKKWAVKYDWKTNRAEVKLALLPSGSTTIKDLRGDDLTVILKILSMGSKHAVDTLRNEISVIE